MSDKVTRLFSTSIGRQSKLCSGHAPRRHECGILLIGVRQEAGAGGAIISFDAVCGLAFRLTATVTTVKKAVYRLEPLLRRQDSCSPVKHCLIRFCTCVLACG